MVIERKHATPKLNADQRADFVRRACVAWIKAGGTEMPDSARSAVKGRLGRLYVVLHGKAGVLAVYRLRPDSMTLRLLKRYPAILNN